MTLESARPGWRVFTGPIRRYVAVGAMVWDTVNCCVYERFLTGQSAKAAEQVLNAHDRRMRERHGMPAVIPLWERKPHPKAGVGFGPQSMGYTL